MPLQKINGIDLYYDVRGRGDPLLFVSGFSSTHNGWLPYVEHFSQSFQTILFDNRGAGQSEAPPPPYSIETLAKDAIDLLNHLEIPKALMVGSSMGTAIIQTLALSAPERVKKGVLIAPFAKLPNTSLRKSEATGKLIQAGVPFDLIVENVLPWLFSNDFLTHPELMEDKVLEMSNNLSPQKPDGFWGQLCALKAFDITSQLFAIKTEMLLIAGEEDLSTPLYCAQLLHKNIPKNHLHIFPKAAHMVHIERRNEVIALIEDFLQS